MGLEAFLDWENRQSARHEFYRGEVFAMVGARRVHGIVALNVATALKSRLKGKPCMVFIENMKLRVADDALFYPDVFVTCDARDLRTEMVFEHPTLVVEVLSESTQAFDRGAKFAAYRSLASLREYLLIDPDLRTVELFRRNAAGLFETARPHRPGHAGAGRPAACAAAGRVVRGVGRGGRGGTD